MDWTRLSKMVSTNSSARAEGPELVGDDGDEVGLGHGQAVPSTRFHVLHKAADQPVRLVAPKRFQAPTCPPPVPFLDSDQLPCGPAVDVQQSIIGLRDVEDHLQQSHRGSMRWSCMNRILTAWK
jgi:hypothetical protein